MNDQENQNINNPQEVENNLVEPVVQDGENEQEFQKRPVTALVIFNVVTSLILAISLIATVALGGLIYVFQDMRQSVNFPDKNDHENLGINTEIIDQLPTDDIVNIALFGIDNHSEVIESKNQTLKGRSDAIIVLSINKTQKTVKLTSVLRDSWVPVEINGTDQYRKINAAYENGGALLAVKTLNRHFGLDIADYVTVSINQLKGVIDKVGGIDVEVSAKERDYINQCLPKNEKKITKTGMVHLNGIQAVYYSRIRKIDGEFSRAARHQEVVFAIFKKILSKPVTEYPSLLRSILALVETSLDYDEILSYVPLATDSSLELSNTTVPGGIIDAERGVFPDTNGLWVYKYDLYAAQDFFHEWIYGMTVVDNSKLESSVETVPDKK